MNHLLRSLVLMLFMAVCVPLVGAAETIIHRCVSADGSVVFSQLPCKDEVPVETETSPPAEFDEPPLLPPEMPETPPLDEEEEEGDSEASESRAACKKRYREEIDAIDAEIRREYSREKDADYKQRLLTLTRKLRGC